VTNVSGVIFSPQEAGQHYVNVHNSERGLIKGSPFEIFVQEAEVGNADVVKVYGTGLAEGATNKPCEFYIDIAQAGWHNFFIFHIVSSFLMQSHVHLQDFTAICLICVLLKISICTVPHRRIRVIIIINIQILEARAKSVKMR
jgi:hypothetical protein